MKGGTEDDSNKSSKEEKDEGSKYKKIQTGQGHDWGATNRILYKEDGILEER